LEEGWFDRKCRKESYKFNIPDVKKPVQLKIGGIELNLH